MKCLVLCWLTIIISIFNMCRCQTINESAELSCDFGQLHFCKWRNVRGVDDNDWMLVESLQADLFNVIPTGVTGRGDKFSAVQGTNSPEAETAWLVSDTIPCQSGNGTLAFALWKSAIPPAVHVCIQKPPTSNTLTCMHKVNGFAGAAWTAQTFNIPPSEEPFAIVLMAFVQLKSDVMGLDMLTYMADLKCAHNRRDDVLPAEFVVEDDMIVPVNSPEATTTPTSAIVPEQPVLTRTTTIRPPINVDNIEGIRRSSPSNIREIKVFPRDSGRIMKTAVEKPQDQGTPQILQSSNGPLQGGLSPCYMAECDFENSLCEYEVYRLDNEAATMRFLCEPLTHNKYFVAAPQGSCFLAMTTVRDVPLIQVLASRSFFLHQAAQLHFRYFVPNDGSGMVMFCINALQDCIWRANRPRRGLEMWWSNSLQLPAGKTQLYFVLQQTRKGTRVAIDNIRIRRKGFPANTVQCAGYDDYDYEEDTFHTADDDQWSQAPVNKQYIEYTDRSKQDNEYYDNYRDYQDSPLRGAYST